MSRYLKNSRAQDSMNIPPPSHDPLDYHSRLPDHSPTPFVSSPDLARQIGVDAVYVKHENDRFGLPAFKVLGSSWATYQLLKIRYGIRDEDWETADQLHERLSINEFLSHVTATDGNHGRGVARVAQWFGFSSRIFVPQGTAQPTIDVIRSEGAHVEVVQGDHTKAVEQAADHDGPVDWLIQDTGWEGYERIPKLIVEGYSTIFHEMEDQLREVAPNNTSGPDVVMVQIGVGSLAEAVIRYFKHRERKDTPIIVGVEPEGAACAFNSVSEGRRVTLWDTTETVMAGLNCGTLSYTSWPFIRDGIDAFVTVSDDRAEEAVRLMQDADIDTSESGAAGLAGLLEMRHQRKLGELLAARDLEVEDASVLLIATEGITGIDAHKLVNDG